MNEKDFSTEEKLNIEEDSYATKLKEDHDGAYFPILHEYPSS